MTRVYARENIFLGGQRPSSQTLGVARAPLAIDYGSAPLQALFARDEYLAQQESKKSPYKHNVSDIAKLLDKYHKLEGQGSSLSKAEKVKARLLWLYEMEMLANGWSNENSIPFSERFCYPNLRMQQTLLREVQVERIELMKQIRADSSLSPAFSPYYTPTSSWGKRELEEREAEKVMKPVWDYLTGGGIRCAHDVKTSNEVLETELMANLSVLMLSNTGKALLKKVYDAQRVLVDPSKHRGEDYARRNLFLVNKPIPEMMDSKKKAYVSGSKMYAEYAYDMPFAWETGRYMSPKHRMFKDAKTQENIRLAFNPAYLQLASVLESYLNDMKENQVFNGPWTSGMHKNMKSWLVDEMGLPSFAKLDALPLIDTLVSQEEGKSEWIMIDLPESESSSSGESELELTLPTGFVKAGTAPQETLLSGFRTRDLDPLTEGSESEIQRPLKEPDITKPGIVRSFDTPLFEWNGASSKESGFKGALVTSPLDSFVGEIEVRSPHQGNRSVVFFLKDEVGNELVLKFLKEGSFSEDAAKEAFAANFLKAFGTPALQSQSCILLEPKAPEWVELIARLKPGDSSRKLESEYRTSLAKSLPYILVMEKAGGHVLDLRHVNYGNSRIFMHNMGELSFFELLMGNHDRVLSGIYMMNIHFEDQSNLVHIIDHLLSPGGMSACLDFALNQESSVSGESRRYGVDPNFSSRLADKYATTFTRLFREFLRHEDTSLARRVKSKSNARPDRVHFASCKYFDLGFVNAALSFLRMEGELVKLTQHDFGGKDGMIMMFLEMCRQVNEITRKYKDRLKTEIDFRSKM
ncbi:hypothetical protein [Aureibacter tunicatorum]|uniref:Uncharacterized protein n=1 Tax=Aureibacter tunicatorum TaxID=866807 RepID=A0AAE3XRL7_9BACT|nr:hypothetical protein [Aureibacter tunicatorum]MDR6240749.1 hypothetical protein [Aureibacter tunicatorum]BDD06918.1 hypothetical protein AUTU_44010 [Aureibacter tunicatorum]